MSKVGEWFKGLSTTGQVAITSAALVLGLGTIGTLAQPGGTQINDSTQINTAREEAEEKSTSPVITYDEVNVKEPIPHGSKTVEDANLTKGIRETRAVGVDGVRTKTYRLTLTDGEETERRLVKNSVTTSPVTEIIAVGTYVKPEPVSSCDPNYSGACVPIASDVDCGGGSGNGPAYVYSSVTVIGYDIYGLDGDGDGYGCE